MRVKDFFKECHGKKWKYMLRYKEGSIPSINQEYQILKKLEKNRQEQPEGVYDYVIGIDYHGESINVVEYEDKAEGKKFVFVTDLSITGRNVKETVERGRWRWKIENEGFNTQKKQGYYLEHRFSHDYRGMKNHYYLIQIGHMIAQIPRSVGEAVEESKTKQGAKAPAAAQCVEKQTDKRK